MRLSQRLTAGAIVLIFGLGMFAVPTQARASEEGRRNTALALGAVAAGLLLTQKNKVPGIVVAAGAAYAYNQYQRKVNDRRRWDRDCDYNDRYDQYDRYNRDDRYSQYDRRDRYDRQDRNNNDDRRYDRRHDNRDGVETYGRRR